MGAAGNPAAPIRRAVLGHALRNRLSIDGSDYRPSRGSKLNH